MSRSSTAFSCRFNKQGDKIEYSQEVFLQSGAGTSLFQIVDATSGVAVPDWSVAANQPILQIVPHSANGFAVQTTNVVWSYNGTDLQFGTIGDSWTAETTGKPFSARISNGLFQLRVTNNLASASVVGNKQIGYEVTYRSNGRTGTFNGFATVELQQGGNDSHFTRISVEPINAATGHGGLTLGVIQHNGVDLNITQTTLTATSFYGASPVTVGQGNYTMQWYKGSIDNANAISGATAAALTVTRDMIDGAAIFIAVLKHNGNVVAQDSQRINDNKDEYLPVATPVVEGDRVCNYVEYEQATQTAKYGKYNLSLQKNGNPIDDTGVEYSFEIYNAMKVLKESGIAVNKRVIVGPEHCLVAGSSINSADAVFDDADIQVTATI